MNTSQRVINPIHSQNLFKDELFCFSPLRFTEQFVGKNIQAVTGEI